MQFWDAYKDNRKLFRTHFSDNHEFFGIGAQYLDSALTNFLKEFEKRGYTSETLIFLLSDHGTHPFSAHFLFLPDNSISIENFLPVLFTIVPQSVNITTKSIIRSNSQSFISSYDIYATLKTIATNTNSTARDVPSYSYFHNAIPSTHDCTNRTSFTER